MTRPGMNDGRCFTSYMPNDILNSQIKQKLNIKTDHEYRKYLQNNAETIMKNMSKVCFSDETKICSSGCSE